MLLPSYIIVTSLCCCNNCDKFMLNFFDNIMLFADVQQYVVQIWNNIMLFVFIKIIKNFLFWKKFFFSRSLHITG